MQVNIPYMEHMAMRVVQNDWVPQTKKKWT